MENFIDRDPEQGPIHPGQTGKGPTVSMGGDQVVDLVLMARYPIDEELRVGGHRRLRLGGPIREELPGIETAEVGFEENVQCTFAGLASR